MMKQCQGYRYPIKGSNCGCFQPRYPMPIRQANIRFIAVRSSDSSPVWWLRYGWSRLQGPGIRRWLDDLRAESEPWSATLKSAGKQIGHPGWKMNLLREPWCWKPEVYMGGCIVQRPHSCLSPRRPVFDSWHSRKFILMLLRFINSPGWRKMLI